MMLCLIIFNKLERLQDCKVREFKTLCWIAYWTVVALPRIIDAWIELGMLLITTSHILRPLTRFGVETCSFASCLLGLLVVLQWDF
jgi:hypothetical protein